MTGRGGVDAAVVSSTVNGLVVGSSVAGGFGAAGVRAPALAGAGSGSFTITTAVCGSSFTRASSVWVSSSESMDAGFAGQSCFAAAAISGPGAGSTVVGKSVSCDTSDSRPDEVASRSAGD